MKKFLSTVLLPVAVLAMIYKLRYKILNMVLSNETMRRMSVKAAMGIPGVRSLLLRRSFRS